jgi:hypothetical protein
MRYFRFAVLSLCVDGPQMTCFFCGEQMNGCKFPAKNVRQSQNQRKKIESKKITTRVTHTQSRINKEVI